MARTIEDHVNSEGERISIAVVESGDFEGRHLLVIHDDPPGRTVAPILLDAGTVEWLKRQLDKESSGK